MRTIIEDTCFPAGTRVRISGGLDEMLFLRCSFEGGEIFVEADVDRTIFSHCVFRGTSFSGQSLSERIAIACQSVRSHTEGTAPSGVGRGSRFRC